MSEHNIKRFILRRHIDPTGISGRGIVAEGVVFSNGKAIVSWRDTPVNGAKGAITVHPDIRNVEIIHCHNGLTEIEWVD